MYVNAAKVLNDRAVGQFPISVATSLAIEGLLGILEENPMVPPPADQYDDICINARTLFRNMTGALKSEDAELISASDYAYAMIEEITLIRSILKDRTDGRMTCWSYAATYKSISTNHRYAIIKYPKTPKQLHYAKLENDVIDEMFRKLGDDNDMLDKVDLTIKGHNRRTVLLSNYPFDLLNTVFMDHLALLESHTGVIKPKNLWYTKLRGGRDMPNMPFNIMTIQMFGDTGGLFSPHPPDNQRKLRAVADQYGWSQLTTKARILQCVGLIHDPVFEANIRKLYS